MFRCYYIRVDGYEKGRKVEISGVEWMEHNVRVLVVRRKLDARPQHL